MSSNYSVDSFAPAFTCLLAFVVSLVLELFMQ